MCTISFSIQTYPLGTICVRSLFTDEEDEKSKRLESLPKCQSQSLDIVPSKNLDTVLLSFRGRNIPIVLFILF